MEQRTWSSSNSKNKFDFRLRCPWATSWGPTCRYLPLTSLLKYVRLSQRDRDKLSNFSKIPIFSKYLVKCGFSQWPVSRGCWSCFYELPRKHHRLQHFWYFEACHSSINTINSSATHRPLGACGNPLAANDVYRKAVRCVVLRRRRRRRRGRSGLTEYCQIPLHHPESQRHREAAGLQQGGRWSCKAQEGFDLRPPTHSRCNKPKPEIPHRTNNKLTGFSFYHWCISFLLFLHPPTVRIPLSAVFIEVVSEWAAASREN